MVGVIKRRHLKEKAYISSDEAPHKFGAPLRRGKKERVPMQGIFKEDGFGGTDFTHDTINGIIKLTILDYYPHIFHKIN